MKKIKRFLLLQNQFFSDLFFKEITKKSFFVFLSFNRKLLYFQTSNVHQHINKTMKYQSKKTSFVCSFK